MTVEAVPTEIVATQAAAAAMMPVEAAAVLGGQLLVRQSREQHVVWRCQFVAPLL
jgi:hypothetical protein